MLASKARRRVRWRKSVTRKAHHLRSEPAPRSLSEEDPPVNRKASG